MNSESKSVRAKVLRLVAMGSFAAVAAMVIVLILITQTENGGAYAGGGGGGGANGGGGGKKQIRGMLGENSNKILVRDGKTLLWASGDLNDPDNAHWYDFTGSPLPAEQLQFGIGKDRIKAIDDPLFVKPDDPQLGLLSKAWYRRSIPPSKTDDIRVMGYVINGEARCYPSALLNRHELVNDRYGNKPVTVGW